MMETLHDLIYQTPWNNGGIVYMWSCRVYSRSQNAVEARELQRDGRQDFWKSTVDHEQ